MSAHVREEMRHIASAVPGIRLAYEGDYYGYYAACGDCGSEDTFHAIGLESAPNAAALDDADRHNEDQHPDLEREADARTWAHHLHQLGPS